MSNETTDCLSVQMPATKTEPHDVSTPDALTDEELERVSGGVLPRDGYWENPNPPV
jgi:hypothetical protein